RRRRSDQRMIARLLLASLACVAGLVLAEAGANWWHAWLHRYPRLPMTFTAPARAGTAGSDQPTAAEPVEIVVVGESSARGEPFSDSYRQSAWLSVGQLVAWQLERVIPERRFHPEVLAVPGQTLEQQHQRLAGLKRRPDALIIYAGHNEFHA